MSSHFDNLQRTYDNLLPASYWDDGEDLLELHVNRLCGDLKDNRVDWDLAQEFRDYVEDDHAFAIMHLAYTGQADKLLALVRKFTHTVVDDLAEHRADRETDFDRDLSAIELQLLDSYREQFAQWMEDK